MTAESKSLPEAKRSRAARAEMLNAAGEDATALELVCVPELNHERFPAWAAQVQ